MNLDTAIGPIIQALRSPKKLALRDPDQAREAIIEILILGNNVPAPSLSQLIYSMALVYTDQTGAMPGYTNSDNLTLFEIFASVVLREVAPKTTQNHLRSEIRKLDARRNAQFLADVLSLRSRSKSAPNKCSLLFEP